MPVFGRIVTAMITPFTEDESLDLDGAQRTAGTLVETGTETVLVCGTTGESPTVTDTERSELLRAVKEAVGDRAQVMVGTGSNATAKSVAATRRAADEGADAVLAVTPYYNKPSQLGLLRHFTAIADVGLPVLLYDIPGRTAREIDTETLVELADVPNVVGVKDAVGDLAKTAEVAARTYDAEGGFAVYAGDDKNLLPMLSVGGVGVVSVASHVAGTELADLARAFESDPAKARELHHRLLPLFRALFLEPNPTPLKAALNALGRPAGPVRLPLVPAGAETVEAVLAGLDHAGIRR